MKNFYFRSIKHSLSFFPCCSTNQRPFCLNLLIIRTEKIGTKNFFERNVAWVTHIRAEMCLLWSFIYFQVNLETREIWKSLCCLLNITVSLNVSFQHQLFVVTCDVECKSSWSVKQLPRKIIALIFLIKILDLKQTIITLKQSKCYILSKNGKEVWVPLFHYFFNQNQAQSFLAEV